MRACVRADGGVFSKWFSVHVETGSLSTVRPCAIAIQHLQTAALKVALAFFNLDPDIPEDMVKMQKRGVLRRQCSEAWDADCVFQDVWGMLYADVIMSQSPGSLGSTMEVVVKVCSAFGLTV